MGERVAFVKEWRIVKIFPNMAIVNIRDRSHDALWTGYTDINRAQHDMARISREYPEARFAIAPYVTLSFAD